MGKQAVALATAVGYHSAGTVEFIVDRDRHFYFLEMNTRLQVEHPVTALVTGIDLVEEMIRIAGGEKLRFSQEDVKLTGWAIESRLYAEDPYRNFLPSIGRLTRYRPPAEGKRSDGTIIRNDTGVVEGSEISMHYDPMIAKLCTWSSDRSSAIRAMAAALDDFELEGIGHNLAFLSTVMGHLRFGEGRLSMAFIAEEFRDGFTGVTPSDADERKLAAVATHINWKLQHRNVLISGAMDNHRRKVSGDWIVALGDHTFPVTIGDQENGTAVSFDDGSILAVASDWLPGMSIADFQIGADSVSIKTGRSGTGYRLRWRGMDVIAHVRSSAVAELARLMLRKQPPDTSKLLLCPMPGVVTAIAVTEGEAVEAGQVLATVEAMKMENVLRAERRATIKRIAANAGASLALDQPILEFE
ncbi:hypothetical protein MesoLj131c_68660 (plasmid) [Mesorhizobium sp. 131-3-5]|nr:hypothetical protein MesoLj131c_68660 [Mesorhizobium sp. 131-3-5]